MTKTLPAAITFILLSTNVFAQKNTYIGAEAAVTHDIYDVIDNGSSLEKDVPIISGYFGLNIRQDVSKSVFLETGLLRKYYNEGIGFRSSMGYSETNAINAWLIPFRLGTKINIAKQKLHLVPVIGFTLGINSDFGYGDGGGAGTEISNKDTITYKIDEKSSLTQTFPLMQTGMGVEFILFRTILTSVAANYYTGFKNVIEQNIEYTHNSVSHTAMSLSKGEMVSFGLSLKYPISNLWRRS